MPETNSKPATKPIRVRLRTKKNPDGSQQYVRGKTAIDQVNTLIKNRQAVNPTPQDAMNGRLPRATVLLQNATAEALRKAREDLKIKRKP